MGDKWAKQEWDARRNRGEKQEESESDEEGNMLLIFQWDALQLAAIWSQYFPKVLLVKGKKWEI